LEKQAHERQLIRQRSGQLEAPDHQSHSWLQSSRGSLEDIEKHISVVGLPRFELGTFGPPDRCTPNRWPAQTPGNRLWTAVL